MAGAIEVITLRAGTTNLPAIPQLSISDTDMTVRAEGIPMPSGGLGIPVYDYARSNIALGNGSDTIATMSNLNYRFVWTTLEVCAPGQSQSLSFTITARPEHDVRVQLHVEYQDTTAGSIPNWYPYPMSTYIGDWSGMSMTLRDNLGNGATMNGMLHSGAAFDGHFDMPHEAPPLFDTVMAIGSQVAGNGGTVSAHSQPPNSAPGSGWFWPVRQGPTVPNPNDPNGGNYPIHAYLDADFVLSAGDSVDFSYYRAIPSVGTPALFAAVILCGPRRRRSV
jgi:hypothetical protein